MMKFKTDYIREKLQKLRAKLASQIEVLIQRFTQIENETMEKLSDSETVTKSKARGFGHLILWVSLAFIIVALIWAKLAILDEVTRGEGKVIPSSQIQVIQNLEGGIVRKIFVHEGDIVKKGQALLQIDDTRFGSSYKENLKKLQHLKLKVARLQAEVDNKPFTVDQTQIKEFKDIAEHEQLLYKVRKQQLYYLQKSYDLAMQEYNIAKPLEAKGAASEVEVLQKARVANEAKSKINNFQSETLDELNTTKSELKALLQTKIAHQDRLSRTTVRSPVNGIVKDIHIMTVGGVIQPGMELMEIVPLEDTLLIEAKINPEDIGFLHPDQKAMVKISAYDFSIYGSLPATLVQISADTLKDENKKDEESYYLIRVRTTKNYLGSEDKPLYIIPGMHATVDILTGEKSVLDTILTPVREAKEKALRER